jgi:hypothetical protein
MDVFRPRVANGSGCRHSYQSVCWYLALRSKADRLGFSIFMTSSMHQSDSIHQRALRQIAELPSQRSTCILPMFAAHVCSCCYTPPVLRKPHCCCTQLQALPAQETDDNGPQELCAGCQEFRNHAADAAENVGGVRFRKRRILPGGVALPGHDNLCAACVRKDTLWTQLTPQA